MASHTSPGTGSMGDTRIGRCEVFVRLRDAVGSGTPSLSVEVDQKRSTYVRLAGSPDQPRTRKEWRLTSGFGPLATQEQVFDKVGSSVSDWIWEGFNACVLCLGPSGSGKSHTMFGSLAQGGSGEAEGLVPRMLRDIFRRVGREDRYVVGLSFGETKGMVVADRFAPNARPTGDGVELETVRVDRLEEGVALLMEAARGSPSWDVAQGSTPAATPVQSAMHTIVRVIVFDTLEERAFTLHLVDMASGQEGGGTDFRALQELIARCARGEESVAARSSASALCTTLEPILGGSVKTFIVCTAPQRGFQSEAMEDTLDMMERAALISNPCFKMRGVTTADVELVPAAAVLQGAAVERSPPRSSAEDRRPRRDHPTEDRAPADDPGRPAADDSPAEQYVRGLFDEVAGGDGRVHDSKLLARLREEEGFAWLGDRSTGVAGASGLISLPEFLSWLKDRAAAVHQRLPTGPPARSSPATPTSRPGSDARGASPQRPPQFGSGGAELQVVPGREESMRFLARMQAGGQTPPMDIRDPVELGMSVESEATGGFRSEHTVSPRPSGLASSDRLGDSIRTSASRVPDRRFRPNESPRGVPDGDLMRAAWLDKDEVVTELRRSQIIQEGEIMVLRRDYEELVKAHRNALAELEDVKAVAAELDEQGRETATQQDLDLRDAQLDLVRLRAELRRVVEQRDLEELFGEYENELQERTRESDRLRQEMAVLVAEQAVRDASDADRGSIAKLAKQLRAAMSEIQVLREKSAEMAKKDRQGRIQAKKMQDIRDVHKKLNAALKDADAKAHDLAQTRQHNATLEQQLEATLSELRSTQNEREVAEHAARGMAEEIEVLREACSLNYGVRRKNTLLTKFLPSATHKKELQKSRQLIDGMSRLLVDIGSNAPQLVPVATRLKADVEAMVKAYQALDAGTTKLVSMIHDTALADVEDSKTPRGGRVEAGPSTGGPARGSGGGSRTRQPASPAPSKRGFSPAQRTGASPGFRATSGLASERLRQAATHA